MSAVTVLLAVMIVAVPVLVIVGTVVGELIVRALPASWREDER